MNGKRQAAHPTPETVKRYRVKQVAQLTGVSVRTLHHYDSIGLLVPSGRTRSGYRLYAPEDLLLLQQILIGRELGYSLEEIKRSMSEPGFDHREALLRQRQQLAQRAEEALRMLRAIDRALEVLAGAEQEGDDMQTDLSELFDGFSPSAYEAEAQQRWGDTEAYQESARRTKGYSKQDWERIREEQSQIYLDAAAAMQAGLPADGAAAREIVERHRRFIDRWFYPCSLKMHCGLAELYDADARFSANIDQHAPGLTAYLVAAIRANAAAGDVG